MYDHDKQQAMSNWKVSDSDRLIRGYTDEPRFTETISPTT